MLYVVDVNKSLGLWGAPQTDEAPAAVRVALVTDDVAAALERAVTAGAREVVAPTKKSWGRTVACVRDCDGNLVEPWTAMG